MSAGARLFQASSQPNVPRCQRSRICSPLWQFLLRCGYRLLGQELAGKRGQVLTGTQVGNKALGHPVTPGAAGVTWRMFSPHDPLLLTCIPLISPLALTSFTFPAIRDCGFVPNLEGNGWLMLGGQWSEAKAGTFDKLTTWMFNLRGHSARIWNVGKLECLECWKRTLFVHRSHSVCLPLPVSLRERLSGDRGARPGLLAGHAFGGWEPGQVREVPSSVGPVCACQIRAGARDCSLASVKPNKAWQRTRKGICFASFADWGPARGLWGAETFSVSKALGYHCCVSF